MFGSGVKRKDKEYLKLLEKLQKQYKKKDYFMWLAVTDVKDNLSKMRGSRDNYLDMVCEIGVAATSKVHNWKFAANSAVRDNYEECRRVYDELGLDIGAVADAREVYQTVMNHKFKHLKEIVDTSL